jgi:hypothetical protein
MPKFYVAYNMPDDYEGDADSRYTYVNADEFEIRDGWLVFIVDGQLVKAFPPSAVDMVSHDDHFYSAD